ncbi:hypothetical protein EW026_g7375 [Hermanssonia centrifuga]|uniref:Uncharacterized protein n=1 Tax=Hermanssonia centrifuga TaxID=98765 RepID=A0A4V3X9F5_9APHY|nr:hypothetical protein EW026_g7375 [Hermanssonia centrifuga]
MHWYESAVWNPNVITFIVMLGIGCKHFVNAPPSAPVTASNDITFATTAASSVISWCTMTPDAGVYHSKNASSLRIFLYTYIGLFKASITVHFLGVIFAASAPNVPTWEAGFDNGNNIGGIINAILSPLSGFGKFLTALLALSIPSPCAPTMYIFGSSFMTIGSFFAKVPRYVYVIISEAILIPVAIVGATQFYATFVDVLSLIGYWSSAFAVIVLVEHFVFRKNDFSYKMEDWNQPRRLPVGLVAFLAFFCAFGIIIPSMSQVWYTGPIGIPVGCAVALVVYLVLRSIENSWTGR